MRRLWLSVAVASALGLGCVGSQDDASQLHDLRMIAASFEPPEIMAAKCPDFANLDESAATLLTPYLAPIEMEWLIVDPAGDGREIDYDIRVCANQNDLRCTNQGDFKVLESGKTTAGILRSSHSIGSTLLVDGDFSSALLLEVINQDQYKGLGGIRVPVVLHLKVGSEEIYAMKLMVYSCRLFADMKANVTPHLRSFTVRGEPWPEGEVKTIRVDDGPIDIEAEDVSDLQESYVVPSIKLEPINLTESWKIAWHTALGRMTPVETGGTDFIGNIGLQKTEWRPGPNAVEGDVDFWMVVRDGRGGESWVGRTAHLIPSSNPDAGR